MNQTNKSKYGAIVVFCDPKNYLSNRPARDAIHTLRFPSKYEYSVYCKLRSYLARANQKYDHDRYTLECQFSITLVGKTGVMKSPIVHVVDFVIRDDQSVFNPTLYVEAKGHFLPEYLTKINMLLGFKPNIHKCYLVVSDKTPPKAVSVHHSPLKKLDEALFHLGIK